MNSVYRYIRVLVIAMLVLGQGAFTFSSSVMAQDQTNMAGLLVKGDHSEKALYENGTVSYQKGATAFDVLIQTLGKDQVAYKPTDYGKMITAIKELKAKDSNFWAFYINGISSPTGADHYKVQNKDRLCFRYANWSVPSANQVTLSIQGDEKTGAILKDKEVSFIKGPDGETPTAFDLLRVTMGHKKIDYKQFDFGKMITSIAGLKATQGESYWALYINGESAQVGVSQYHIEKGDDLSFRYTPLKKTSENGTESKDNNESKKQQSITEKEIQSAINQASGYLSGGQIGTWAAVALRKAGKEVPESYLEGVRQKVKEAKGELERITDYEKYTLGILAAGGDPTNVAGYNLAKHIYNGKIAKQGINGVIYGLIALSSADLEIPSDGAKWPTEKLVQYLVEHQNDDGGWTGYSGKSGLDITAMALTALSDYGEQAKVKKAIDAGVAFLAKQSSSVDNSTSTAQMIIGLTANGIDPTNSEFNKDKNTDLVSYLLSFQNQNGGFGWKKAGEENAFSTEQPLEALVAYDLFVNGGDSLYEFSFNPKNSVNGANADTQGGDNAADSSNEEGKLSPEKAGNIYNWLVLGALVLAVLGISMFLYNRRKK
ncbi:MAG TPA: DUF4430 domain-containing protein [Bacillales bacterium]